MGGSGGYVLVVNAAAGSASERAVREAEAVLARSGGAEVVPTRTPEDLDAVVGRLADRALVVVGGDGSLHAALNALCRARGRGRGRRPETPVGLVPLGTGNDFARTAGLPLEPAPAARALASVREPRSVDLISSDDGTVIANAVHAGIGAEAAKATSGLKGRLGSLAYPLGAAWAGATTRGWDLAVEVDGERLSPPGGDDGRVLLVGVANGCSIGGGTPLAPDARLDDGQLDVVVAAATGPLARAGFARSLRRGRHVARDDVTMVRARSVRIVGEAVRHNADGEVGPPVTDVTYTVVPGGWRLLAP